MPRTFEEDVGLFAGVAEEAEVMRGQAVALDFGIALGEGVDFEGVLLLIAKKEANALNGEGTQETVRHFGEHRILIGLR